MPHAPTLPLDDFDLAILAQLQRDNTVAQRDIAQAVHLSAAAVQRRRWSSAVMIRPQRARGSPRRRHPAGRSRATVAR